MLLSQCGTGGGGTPSPTRTPQPPFTATAPATPALVAVTCTPLPTATPPATATATPTATSTPIPTPTPTATPTPQRPSYTQEELYLAARIISQEAGIGQYFRGTDEQVRQVSIAIAWTMRNRIEVGEPIEAPNGIIYRKEDSYNDTFKFYDPYRIGPLPDEPDPIVLQAVQDVFDAPDRSDDPLQGAIFTLNRACALQKDIEPVYKIEWTPLFSGSATQGKYFYMKWPGSCD